MTENAEEEPTPRMKVSAAIKSLQEMDPDADLLICGHGFPGMENKAWIVTHFAPVSEMNMVLIEGAGDPKLTD